MNFIGANQAVSISRRKFEVAEPLAASAYVINNNIAVIGDVYDIVIYIVRITHYSCEVVNRAVL